MLKFIILRIVWCVWCLFFLFNIIYISYRFLLFIVLIDLFYMYIATGLIRAIYQLFVIAFLCCVSPDYWLSSDYYDHGGKWRKISSPLSENRATVRGNRARIRSQNLNYLGFAKIWGRSPRARAG